MRGDNPILALKLHILLHILMKSICISFKRLEPTFIWQHDQNEGWQPYTSIKTIHIFISWSILMKSICISFKPLQPTFHLRLDDQNEGWQPYTSIKTTHFASYLDEIYMYLLQTFTTHFHLTETIKMRGDNPILALKLHILLHILMKSICISFKHLQPTFIWRDDQNEG